MKAGRCRKSTSAACTRMNAGECTFTGTSPAWKRISCSKRPARPSSWSSSLPPPSIVTSQKRCKKSGRRWVRSTSQMRMSSTAVTTLKNANQSRSGRGAICRNWRSSPETETSHHVGRRYIADGRGFRSDRPSLRVFKLGRWTVGDATPTYAGKVSSTRNRPFSRRVVSRAPSS